MEAFERENDVVGAHTTERQRREGTAFFNGVHTSHFYVLLVQASEN